MTHPSHRHWTVRVRRWLDSPFSARGHLFWILIPLLGLLSVIWTLVAARRRRKGYRPFSEGAWPRVWCVGNVVLGGAGKSPLVRAVAHDAFRRGLLVAIVTRGTGESQGPVFAGRGLPPAFERSLSRSLKPVTAALLGDEAREHLELLSLAFPELPLVVVESRRRRVAIESLREGCLEAAHNPEGLLIILDDGFQHFDAPRNANLLVLNPSLLLRSPPYCPPLGPYREGSKRTLGAILDAADVRFWSRVPAGREAAFATEMRQSCLRFDVQPGPHDVLVRSRLEFRQVDCELGTLGGVEDPRLNCWGDRLAVVTGIAHGERFVCDVLEAVGSGLVTASIIELPDHGKLSASALGMIGEAETLVLTGKDYFRWAEVPAFRKALQGRRVYVAVLAVDLVMPSGEAFSPVDMLLPLG